MAGKIIICDLDGTVWDSYPCYAAALERLGICASGEAIKLLRSGSNLIGLARKFRVTNAELSRACSECADHLKLFPRVRESLEKLRADRVPLGIVTNLPSWFIAPLLDAVELSKFFSSTVAAAGKPRPTGLLRARAELNGRPQSVSYYIGDTEGDARASEAAGIPFIWAAYGYGAEPKSAHAKITRFDQVLGL